MYSRWTEVEEALVSLLSGERASSLETATLDFKQDDRRSKNDLIKTVVDAVLCFANGQGGYVVVGIDDHASGATAVTGTELDPETLRRRIYELTLPPLLVDFDVFQVSGQSVLAVHVPASIDIHSDSQGRAPRRVGTDCLPMSPDDQRRLREERRGIDWSGHPTELTVDDVDPAALDVARRHLGGFTDERRNLASLSDADLLRALGVLDNDGKLLRAGQVLFCSSPGHPKIVYQYQATSGGEARVVERLDGPLVSAFQRTMELVQIRLELTPVTLPTGQQIQIEDFPELVVREALSNAVVHRDLHLDAFVSVEHSPTMFIVTSPGPLVAGVTTQNILTHPSKPRNQTLARAARTLGLAEELGRGVDRMYREMVRSGKAIPTIEDSFDSVRVVLTGTAPNVRIARYVRQLPENEQEDVDAMLVLFTLCQQRTVEANSIRNLLQRTVDETELILRRLATSSVSMIEPTRESSRLAHPIYRLTPKAIQSLGTAVPYNKAPVQSVDRKVIAHVNEYGKITNKTIQNLLDVSLQQASIVLADLVEREFLIKISKHQRGPGVEYGKGARFPKKVSQKRSSKSASAADGLEPPT